MVYAASTMRALGIAAVLIGAWQALVSLAQLPAYFVPGPLDVAVTLADKAGFLAGHAATTAGEIVVGLIVGIAAGMATALAMSAFLPVRRLLFPLVVMSQALPVFAIAPLLVLWLGYGLASKIAMAAIIIYFPVASAFYDGLRRTPPHLIDLARIFQATPLQELFRVRFPAALPALGSGIRVAAAVAPIGAVVGEWVGSAAGLGFVMLHANARMQTDLVFAALIVLALMALALRFVADRAVKALIPWAEHAA